MNWSMISNSLLDQDIPVSIWYKQQVHRGITGVSHDGVFTVFVVSPPNLMHEVIELMSDTYDELLNIGKHFLANDQGKILVGSQEVFHLMYQTQEYQERIQRLNPPENDQLS